MVPVDVGVISSTEALRARTCTALETQLSVGKDPLKKPGRIDVLPFLILPSSPFPCLVDVTTSRDHSVDGPGLPDVVPTQPYKVVPCHVNSQRVDISCLPERRAWFLVVILS